MDEFEIIRRHFAALTRPREDVALGIGDDAAVLRMPAGEELVATTDTLLPGVHFHAGAAPFDIGFKSLAVNLSDLAAMGAEPRWALLALAIPDAETGWLQDFAGGFRTLADRHGVCLVGGNLARGPLNVTAQALGSVPAGAAIRRDSAAPGDLVYVTGELGGAGLALASLIGAGTDRTQVPEACFERLHRPEPRVAAGIALRGLASAAIDLSDGLAADLGHLCRQSGAGAAVQLGSLPLCRGLEKLSDEEQRWDLALGAGDDYELCFAVPPDRRAELERVMRRIDQRITQIGVFTRQREAGWLKPDGRQYEPRLHGYRHFR